MKLNKNGIFCVNTALFTVVVLMTINIFNLPGSGLIKTALASIGAITGEGTINYLARFAGSANPSNFIGDSLIFDNGTNVGIGTTTPVQKLHVRSSSGIPDNTYFTTNDFVSGTTGSAFNIQFGASSGNTYTRLRALHAGAASWNNLVLQDGGGNVGIGTTAPGTTVDGMTARLDVTGNIRTDNYVVMRSWPGFGAGSGRIWYDGAGGSGDATGYLGIGDDTGDGRLVLQRSTGNVGIGTTAPSAKLEVNGAIRLTPTTAPATLVNGMMWME